MKTFERIVAATDFTPASRPVLDEAERIARECGAQLLIVHAYQVPAVGELAQEPAGVHDDFVRAVRGAAEPRLAMLVAQARSRGIDARALLREGFADDEILDAARRERADLIVVGTHGRRGVSRMLVGSVAWQVVSRSACPVMTVPSGPSRATRSARA